MSNDSIAFGSMPVKAVPVVQGEVRYYAFAMAPLECTTKQQGDACEMLIAAELTLTGNVPAIKMPDGWPEYDVITQPTDGGVPQRVSVKSRTYKCGSGTYVVYDVRDQFDWLAIVLLPGGDQACRRIFIVPREIADARARKDSPTAKTAHERYWRQDEIAPIFAEFENNFCLSRAGPFAQAAKTVSLCE